MKVAIFSDIHGNFPALREVIEHSSKIGCEKFLFLGDYIGYFSFSKKVVELLMETKNAFFIKGNHEIILERALNDIVFKNDMIRKYGYGHQDAIESLSPVQLAWLKNMREKASVEIEGALFFLTHGSPNLIDEYIYPDANAEYLESFSDPKYDFILMGHTHYQFYRKCKHSMLINPGSVGQARDIRGMAAYVTLDTDNWVVVCHRIPYEKEELIENIKKTGGRISMLLRSLGEDFEEV